MVALIADVIIAAALPWVVLELALPEQVLHSKQERTGLVLAAAAWVMRLVIAVGLFRLTFVVADRLNSAQPTAPSERQ